MCMIYKMCFFFDLKKKIGRKNIFALQGGVVPQGVTAGGVVPHGGTAGGCMVNLFWEKGPDRLINPI